MKRMLWFGIAALLLLPAVVFATGQKAPAEEKIVTIFSPFWVGGRTTPLRLTRGLSGSGTIFRIGPGERSNSAFPPAG